MDAYKKDYLSATPGAYFWTGVTFAGLAYNKSKVTGADIPKTYKDINNPRFRNKISCKISSSGIQYVQWYLLRQIYGNDFWKEFAKQRPRAFDSRVQLFDRLAKGDDDMRLYCASNPAFFSSATCFGTSVAMKALLSSLVSTTGSSSDLFSRSAMAGSRMVSRISALTRSQMSRGVPLGAQSPYQDWKS